MQMKECPAASQAHRSLESPAARTSGNFLAERSAARECEGAGGRRASVACNPPLKTKQSLRGMRSGPVGQRRQRQAGQQILLVWCQVRH